MSSSFFSVLIFLEAGFSSVPLRFLFDLQSFNECGSSITAMKSTRHCKNCGSSFNVDSCNVRHHSHCPVAVCQRARRALAQACRRALRLPRKIVLDIRAAIPYFFADANRVVDSTDPGSA